MRTQPAFSRSARGSAWAALALGAVNWGVRAGALRLPVRPCFQATGLLLYVMAFVFAGKGVIGTGGGKGVHADAPALGAGASRARHLPVYAKSLAPQLLLLIAAAISAAVILRRESVRGRGGRIAAPNSAQ